MAKDDKKEIKEEGTKKDAVIAAEEYNIKSNVKEGKRR